jgi:WD40 repeat protein
MTTNTLSSDKILYLSFNQDASCFAVGTETGFKIYSSYPLNHCYERNLNGGIGIIEMLYKSNILGLVGGGTYPKFSKNKLIIWDDMQCKEISELKFSSNVLNIKLKKDKIFSICENKIFIFNFQTYQNIDIIETKDNPKGLIAISYSPNVNILAYPILNNKDSQKGKVKIKNYDNNGKEIEITAHENLISYILINNEGTILATASERGTIIRTFRCIDGLVLQEFKRGNEKADINYLCFDNLGIFLAATSDRGTIHIWSMKSSIKKIKENEIGNNINLNNKENDGTIDFNNFETKKNNIQDNLPENKISLFNFFGVKTERSFAQIRLNDEHHYKCCFLPDNNIFAVSYIGKYIFAKLDTKKGEVCNIDESGLLSEKKFNK